MMKTHVCSTDNTGRIVLSGLQFEIVASASWLMFLEVPVHYWST